MRLVASLAFALALAAVAVGCGGGEGRRLSHDEYLTALRHIEGSREWPSACSPNMRNADTG